MKAARTGHDWMPVILGGNRGAYSLARAFYEAYQLKSAVLSSYVTGPISHSNILFSYPHADIHEQAIFFSLIRQIDQDFPDSRKILFASDDVYLADMLKWKSCFPDHWIIPYVDFDAFQNITNKERFYQLCEQEGIPYPQTQILYQAEEVNALRYPVILKPADSFSYQRLAFDGKKKVYLCRDEAAYQRVITLIRESGYLEPMIAQEYIAGDDSSLGIITAYSSVQDRKLKLAAFGNVLLDDHTPSAVGNSLAVLVRDEKKIIQSVKKIIEASEYFGFATFDVKYDRQRGEYVFFEVNARLGISNYYVTAAGQNVASFYVRDFIEEVPLLPVRELDEILLNIVPRFLLFRHVKSKSSLFRLIKLYWKRQVVHPLAPAYEKNLKRKFYIFASKLRFIQKMRRFPPIE